MMFQHMNKITACLFVLMIVSPLYAQDRQPIIDMHLHAYPVGHFWPAGAPNPATGVPSPETDDELFRQTREAMDRHNIVLAVTSGYPYDVVLDWTKAVQHGSDSLAIGRRLRICGPARIFPPVR